MKDLYEAYKDKAIVLMIYIREAHPVSADQKAADAGWKVIDGTVFYQPQTYQQRRKLAKTACTLWELSFPALVDTMQPSIGETYQAWPNRLYVLDANGKIAQRGVKGPRGVNVHEGELKIRELLGITDGKLATKPGRRSFGTSGRGRLQRGGQRPER